MVVISVIFCIHLVVQLRYGSVFSGISNGISLTQTQELAKFSANRLPTNKMAAFIERSVNKQLKIADCPHVSIRVLSCCNKIAEVQPKMQARFPDYPKQFPYRHKALFAFTQVDNRDVCIFGMTVQEYGSDCPQPNTRFLFYLVSQFIDIAKLERMLQMCSLTLNWIISPFV